MKSTKTNLSGPRHAPTNGAAPQNLVILLHGVGADGNDLIGLAPHWARHLPDTEFVSPHAPYPYDKAPQGRQWFSIRDFSPEILLAGVRETAPILNQFIDEQLARTGLSDDRLALVGFSQGTMMALFVALRRTRPNPYRVQLHASCVRSSDRSTPRHRSESDASRQRRGCRATGGFLAAVVFVQGESANGVVPGVRG